MILRALEHAIRCLFGLETWLAMSGSNSWCSEARTLTDADKKAILELATLAQVQASEKVVLIIIELVSLGVKARDVVAILRSLAPSSVPSRY